MVQLVYYQHKLKQGYDANMKLRPLAPRDLVLRKVLGTAKNLTWRKLGPNWEGPYRITSVAGIQPEKVLLLIKVFSTILLFITLCVIFLIIYFNIKQNLGHIWLLGPYTLGKLIFSIIFLSVK